LPHYMANRSILSRDSIKVKRCRLSAQAISMNWQTNRKKEIPKKLIALGLYLLVLYHFVMVWYDYPEGLCFEKIVAGSFLFFAGVLFGLGALIEIRKQGLSPFSPVTRVLFFFLMSWGLVVIIRSLSMDASDLRSLFAHPTALWVWIMPVVMLVGAQRSYWKILNRAFILSVGMAIILSIIILLFDQEKAVEFVASPWGGVFMPSSFLLLTWFNQSKAGKYVVLFGIFAHFVGSVLLAARVSIAILFCYITCFIGLCLLDRNKRSKKIAGAFFVISFVVILAGCTLWLLRPYSEFIDDRIDNFNRGLYVDTRSNIVNEFIESMEGQEMIIGRGALGRYWSPFFVHRYTDTEGADSPDRLVIESGFLCILLKGGCIMLLFFIAITVPAAILGIFYSRNLLVRACGLYILITLITMIPSLHLRLNLPFVLFWLSVGACLCKKTRYALDEEIF